MHRVWLTPVAVLFCIAAVTGVVSVTGDSHILVSPPEIVGEGFLRAIVKQRFSQALPFLDQQLRESAGQEAMRDLLIRLEREHGKIEDVRGERSEIHGAEARAAVTIRTDGAEVPLRLHLRRQKHLWKISAIP